MNKCLYCSKETENPKFCSKSCSASYSNKKNPKRKKRKYFCIICNKEIGYRQQYCQEHNKNFTDWNSITYAEILNKRSYQKNSRIRNLARIEYHKLNSCVCANCGYDKHIEVCHIKPISEHSQDTKISEINKPTNLIGLCPNCHWELDNGLLTIEQILSSP